MAVTLMSAYCCVYCNIGPGGRDPDVGSLLCVVYIVT